MADGIIKKVKVSIKGQDRILAILKDVEKSDNLKNIRDKNPKITQQYHFLDGENIIDFDIEEDYEIGPLIDSEGKLYISLNNNNLNSKKNPSDQKPKKPFPKDLKKLIVKYWSKELLPCFKYPSKQIISKRYYTLLVMGETGSGKTSLLDAFVNYLSNINYEDPWRYKLVDENDTVNLDEGKSQTSDIETFYVNYQREDGEEINIKIIDTPGFGDTSGVLKDNIIIEKFRNFFQTTLELDYILVTIKSSTTRWTSETQYVYDRVQEIFGKDAKERFILMCTFADGQKPPVIEALEGNLHYEDYFCFNNSALYIPSEASNDRSDNTKFFWKLGMENVKRFLNEIIKKNLPPLSLKLTRQVMEKRALLFANVKSSQSRVNELFKRFDKFKELLDAIKKNKRMIDENKNYIYIQIRKIPRVIYLDNDYQFCGNCKYMCCQVCKWPQNEQYSMCTDFKNGGRCSKCPGHCDRSAHYRCNKYLKYEEKEEKAVYNAKKELYDEGKENLSRYERLLNEANEKMRPEGKIY